MIRHLQEEKKNLLASAQELEKKNKSLEVGLITVIGISGHLHARLLAVRLIDTVCD